MVISIFNRKGGVGKTTTSVMLSSILASTFNKRIALIDLDSQADTKTTFKIPNNQTDRNIWNVLFDFDKLVGVRIHGNFIFINGSKNMEGMRFYSEAIASNKNPDFVLRNLLMRYSDASTNGLPDIISKFLKTKSGFLFEAIASL
jgi:chromosome partitioning protein